MAFLDRRMSSVRLGNRSVLELSVSSVPEKAVRGGGTLEAQAKVWLSDTPNGRRLLKPIVGIYAELEGHSWCCRPKFESKGARRQKIFDYRQKLWPPEGCDPNDYELGTTLKCPILEPGDYSFSIEIEIPDNLPSSFVTKNGRGGIEYRVRIAAELGGRWLFPSSWTQFKVVERQNIMDAALREPISQAISHNGSRSILAPWSVFQLSASVPRRGYRQGEIIPVCITTSKQSPSRSCMVKAKLIQRVTYRFASGGSSGKKVGPDRSFETIYKVGEQYRETKDGRHEACLLLQIPPDSLTAKADCIWVEYFVQATLKDALRRFRKELLMPVTIIPASQTSDV